ncbi:MAG: chemotaxis protein CheW [Phycisphaerae bacterium]|nr:chemotaxis protein CheW [Phycisphaerae bacterium]
MRALVFDTQLPDGPRRWAIGCSAIVELLPVVSWRPVSGSPPWTLGLFERKRLLMPLIDLSVRLGGPPAALRLGSRILLVYLAPERADAGSPVGRLAGLGGLLVESMLGLETIDWTTDGAHAGFACALDSPFGPLVSHDGTTVQLLHTERLLNGDERALLFPESGRSAALAE